MKKSLESASRLVYVSVGTYTKGLAAVCEILARLQDSPQLYHLVVRDSKGP
jgi:hypothetical protein